MVPLALGFGLGAKRGPSLVAKLGTKKVAVGGLLIVAASLTGFSILDGSTSYWIIGTVLAFLGIGLGTLIVPSTDAVMGAVPEANSGVGSAVNDSARQIGYALGVGVVGSVLNTAYAMNIRDGITGISREANALANNSIGGATQVAASIGGPVGDSLRAAANIAFMDAFGVAMIVAAGVAFIGALVAMKFMPARDVTHGEGDASNSAVGRSEAVSHTSDVSGTELHTPVGTVG